MGVAIFPQRMRRSSRSTSSKSERRAMASSPVVTLSQPVCSWGSLMLSRVAASAARNSSALWNRSCGFLASALSTTASTASERFRCGANSRSFGAGVFRCLAAMAIGCGPSNGGLPVNSSKSSAPALYRSLRASSGSPETCSGLMYKGVPTKSPRPVLFLSDAAERRASASLAMPKSTTLTKSSPSRVRKSITFAGLTSRWMMPASCASASERSSWMPTVTARRSLSAPSAASTCARSRPGTYSMAMNRVRSGSSPKSKTETVLECDSLETICASWLKRLRALRSSATSGRKSLSATSLPMRTCSAL
ncbi:MAG: hypothetical protein QM765_19630 [Myxococcales bacterium]